MRLDINLHLYVIVEVYEVFVFQKASQFQELHCAKCMEQDFCDSAACVAYVVWPTKYAYEYS